MHLNILQSLHHLTFGGIRGLDIPIDGLLCLSTRAEITAEVVEGKIAKEFIKLPLGTGPMYPAHLYAFDVKLPGGDEITPHFLKSFASRSQLFLEALWLVKDNSGNSGALYGVTIGEEPMQSNIPHSVVNCCAACTTTETEFTRAELDSAITHYHQLLDLMPKEEAKGVGPPPMALRHPSRLGRALYFTQAARSTSEVGIKSAMYCIAFEGLFSTIVDGATKCVARRGSRFLETDDAACRATYRCLHRLYEYRSRVVHGSGISEKRETKLRDTTVAADEHLRRAFRMILASPDLIELFSTDDKHRLDAYFNDEFSKAT